MLRLARWSTTHRLYIAIAWGLILVAANVLAHSVGTSYSNNFTIPNSDAQRAADLLQRSFPAQAGDRDAIVFKVAHGTVSDTPVRARVSSLLAEVPAMPHVASVTGPYAPGAGAKAISADGRIAFATVLFDRRANELPKGAAKRVVSAAAAAVFLDAVVVRCLLLPAVLDLLGSRTWALPARFERLLPRLSIEGAAARLTPADEAHLREAALRAPSLRPAGSRRAAAGKGGSR
jgi:uncharacterized membrane protein YdfJ with MMPL/SSD domain